MLTVVCLANTAGGDLYLGVEDDGTVTGLHPEHRDEARLGDLGPMDFSARPVSGTTPDDLDPEERRRLREIHRRFQASSDPSLRDLSDDDLDGALGFVEVVDGRRTPTVTGLLVLGRERACCAPRESPARPRTAPR